MAVYLVQALQELKSSLKDQLNQTARQPAVASVGGFETSLDTLEVRDGTGGREGGREGGLTEIEPITRPYFPQEESQRKKSIGKMMGLEGSKEEEDAAKIIQGKFRDMKIRKLGKHNGADSGETVKQATVFLGWGGVEGGLMTDDMIDATVKNNGTWTRALTETAQVRHRLRRVLALTV